MANYISKYGIEYIWFNEYYTGLSLSLLILSISEINNEILLYYLNYYNNKSLNTTIYKVKLNNGDAIISSTLRLHVINTDEKVWFWELLKL